MKEISILAHWHIILTFAVQNITGETSTNALVYLSSRLPVY
jgi:hypothetical protein